ncbi:arginine deiminase family protein [Sulfurisphaera ohwakuensis]|uniref:Arginine deiminase n=2 Tax=Sulfurisphaera ohwakuensis TaxID=69656 RepID=A0A7J9RUU1_SULOH|nr:arginine deiminase family protein [Sulfurisphaera ohwakuensis]MBB5254733.1 arginine deiminase [Sulfurisphaera ohwakuensis]
MSHHNMSARAEWEKLREVVVHKPGYEVLFALLNPSQFLFERPFSLTKARREHDKLRKTLEKEGVRVHRLKGVIITKMRNNYSFLEKVKGLVGVDTDDPNYLIELLILNPVIKNENVIIADPLPNLYFMRDQQITTIDGVIIGKMATKQRERETEVTKLFWEALGIKYKEIKKGKLEGGDYFPMKDFHIIGIGNRTDFTGATNLFNLGEVAVVYETRKEFFHLDMFFNVPSSNTVVGVKKLMEESRTEVYNHGKLVEVTNLYEYIKKKGFNIIEIDENEAKIQLGNFLTIDDGKIISPRYSRKFRELDVIEVNVENLTGGNGGIHCMTGVVRRG